MNRLAEVVNWTTRDGRKAKIAELETTHLANILAYLERNATGFYIQVAVSLLDHMPDDVADDFATWTPVEIVRCSVTYQVIAEELQLRYDCCVGLA